MKLRLNIKVQEKTKSKNFYLFLCNLYFMPPIGEGTQPSKLLNVFYNMEFFNFYNFPKFPNWQISNVAKSRKASVLYTNLLYHPLHRKNSKLKTSVVRYKLKIRVVL